MLLVTAPLPRPSAAPRPAGRGRVSDDIGANAGRPGDIRRHHDGVPGRARQRHIMILQGTFHYCGLVLTRAHLCKIPDLRRALLRFWNCIAPPSLRPDALPLFPLDPRSTCLPIPGHALSRTVPAPASDASPTEVHEQHLEAAVAVAVTAGHDIGEARIAMHGMRGAVDAADACWLLLVPPCQHSSGLPPQAAPLVCAERCGWWPSDTFLEGLHHVWGPGRRPGSQRQPTVHNAEAAHDAGLPKRACLPDGHLHGVGERQSGMCK